MTGFARAEGRHGPHDWMWEIKSVNGKGLDVRLRLPNSCDGLEGRLRDAIAARFKRGSIAINLGLSRDEGAPRLRINAELLDQVLAIHRDLDTKVDPTPPRIEGLLAIRGMVETADEEEESEADAEARAEALIASFEVALDQLVVSRAAEGSALAEVLDGLLKEIVELVDAATATAATQPAAVLARLRNQMAELLDGEPALPEDRLAHEAALIAAKGDIREELDRLHAHIAAAYDLLAEQAPVGRRLDFLCQEFNREANTLCSKSSDIDLTRIGLALKAAIERLREQVQNIE